MLYVKGNKIFDPSDQPVRLMGVNRAGLEWDSRDDRIVECVKQACDDWKCNLIRIPVSQDRWFGFGKEQQKKDITGEGYRQKVDEIVTAVHGRGKYMILDLHWSNMNEWGGNDDQHRMPDLNSLLFWKDAAARYKNHPAVLFGLYNEPHSVSWDVWKNGGTVTEKKKTYSSPGHQKIADNIRRLGAKNILIIAGLDWGFTLEELCNGYEIKDKNGNGIIYDSHIYPWKPLKWDKHVGKAAKKYPLLIGEFGHYGDKANPREGKQRLKSGVWMPRLLEWIDKPIPLYRMVLPCRLRPGFD
jgi:aryl-phospho-beta-D-glucosidase BglC (GH1 family)